MRWIVLKVAYMVPVVLVVTFITFLLLHILPGDVTVLMLGQDATQEAVAQARAGLQLDDPILVQYWRWLVAALSGDFGRSHVTGQLVGDALSERLGVSFQLMIMAQSLALLLAIPSGILCGYRAGRNVDRLLTGAAFGVVSLPIFIKSMLLMILFAVFLR